MHELDIELRETNPLIVFQKSFSIQQMSTIPKSAPKNEFKDKLPSYIIDVIKIKNPWARKAKKSKLIDDRENNSVLKGSITNRITSFKQTCWSSFLDTLGNTIL